MHVHKISILPPQKALEFPEWVRGFYKTPKFKEMCEALLEFSERLRGWGDLEKSFSNEVKALGCQRIILLS